MRVCETQNPLCCHGELWEFHRPKVKLVKLLEQQRQSKTILAVVVTSKCCRPYDLLGSSRWFQLLDWISLSTYLFLLKLHQMWSKCQQKLKDDGELAELNVVCGSIGHFTADIAGYANEHTCRHTLWLIESQSEFIESLVYKQNNCSTLMSHENNKSITPALRLKHLPFVLLPDVVFLWEVNEVNHWFGCQKQVFVQHVNLWRKQRREAARNKLCNVAFEAGTDRDKWSQIESAWSTVAVGSIYCKVFKSKSAGPHVINL